MKKTTRTRTPKRTGIGRAPAFGRSVRAASRELPAFEDVVVSRPRRRAGIAAPVFLDEDIRRGPGRPGMRAPRGRAPGRRK